MDFYKVIALIFISVHFSVCLLIFSFRRTSLVSPTKSNIAIRHRENQDFLLGTLHYTLIEETNWSHSTLRFKNQQNVDYMGESKTLKASYLPPSTHFLSL